MSVIRPRLGHGMISDNRPDIEFNYKIQFAYGKNQFQTKRRQSVGAGCTR